MYRYTPSKYKFVFCLRFLGNNINPENQFQKLYRSGYFSISFGAYTGTKTTFRSTAHHIHYVKIKVQFDISLDEWPHDKQLTQSVAVQLALQVLK